MSHRTNENSQVLVEIRRIAVGGQPRQIVLETLSQKYPEQKRAGGVAQMVEHLPNKLT
jgi:hypothetical protein